MDDFCGTTPDKVSYKVKLDDSDFESALLKEVRIITFISFCSCMETFDVVLSNPKFISSCSVYLHSTALKLCLAYV